MRRTLLALFLLPFTFLLSQSNTPPSFLKEDPRWADSIIRKLSLEEKIAQLIMVKAFSNKDDRHVSEVAELVSRYKVGGIIFFQGGPVRQARLTNMFQSLAKVPLFIGIDGEWGLSMRLDSTMVYPKEIMLGALQHDTLIYKMGADIAWQLHRMGIHMNFAPVVDVNNNPANPVIGSRSFGEDRVNVTTKGLMYMKGLQDNRIIATAKHFPGHGDTETDSHYGLPQLPFSRSRLDSLELFPFNELICHGVASIMVAHLSVPALDSTTKLPSSLSSVVVKNILKEQMQYEGLVFTDALNMKGSANTGKPWDVAFKAFMAGNDILLMPDEVPTVIQKICNAVSDSMVSEADIDARCRKVLMAKKWVGLDHYTPVKMENLVQELNNPALQWTRQQLIEESITMLRNEQAILPVKKIDGLRIATLSVGTDSLSVFQKYCDLYAPMKHFCIDRSAGKTVFDSITNLLDSFDLIIAAVVNTDIRVTKNYGITDVCVAFLNQLSERRNVVLTVCASPYAVARFGTDPKFKAILVTYEDKDVMQAMAAQMIFGAIPAKGKLPVTVSQTFKKNDGIIQNRSMRLKYTLPEEIGIATSSLAPVDSIVNDAIAKHAFPGAQVIIAQGGRIFYRKNFGYHTYDSTQAVRSSDIYDIASVSKIAATTTALIKLYDNNDISLSRTIGSYVPGLRKSDKKNITIKELLMHQSGLKSWMPVYLSALVPVNSGEQLLITTKKENFDRPIHDVYINNHVMYNPALISHTRTDVFTEQVSDSLYTTRAFRDTVIKRIAASKLNKKEYKYSDLGVILLQSVVDAETGIPFDSFLNANFYRPMGLKTLGYHPMSRFAKDRIVPSEYDSVFRKQLIHGTVDDANCAMMGGISGHAGLFSNADDLAALMQMYLNKGVYGGKRYLSEKHIDEFTRCQMCPLNRRGLGFDKPEPDTAKDSPVSKLASLSSYGHTGFTGIMVWVDPAYDLVYVFLSNRVYPDAGNNKMIELNVRTQIQDVVYRLLESAPVEK